MDQMTRDTLTTGLAMVFGPEWIRLPPADQALIVRDCTEEGGVQDLAVYSRAIGRGNLDSYVRCQRIRFARDGRHHDAV